MPKRFPPEFKRDVVAVARRGDLTVPEVAVDFGISEEWVCRWCARPTSAMASPKGRPAPSSRSWRRCGARRGDGERDPPPRGGLLRRRLALKMSFPLVRDLAAEGIPVRLSCGTLGFSTQAFCKWRARPVTDRDWDDTHMINELIGAHADDPEFGYRFLTDELARVGLEVGERRAWRLCSQQGLWSTISRKGRRGKGKRPGPAVHDDLVRRDFHAPAPNLLWLTDITEQPTAEGKLYCCAIKDVFSNRIVGYAASVASHPSSSSSRSHLSSRPRQWSDPNS